MFCPNCNKENPDNSAFCTFCGTKLEQQTACDQTQSAEEAFPVIATLKKHASSTMFLVAAILFAVGVGIDLLTTFVTSGTISFNTSILAAIAARLLAGRLNTDLLRRPFGLLLLIAAASLLRRPGER